MRPPENDGDHAVDAVDDVAAHDDVTGDADVALPPPGNADTQAEQAAGLVEPEFDHHLDDEAALLEAEFGEPDAEGWFGRAAAPPDPLPVVGGGS